MTTMKAVRLFEFGGPDKLVYGDHPLPELGPGDVLVKVLATSVSRWDVKYRSGECTSSTARLPAITAASTAAAPSPCPCSSGATSPVK